MMPISEKDLSLIKQDFGAAMSGRSTWEGQAQDIIDFMMPMRPDIIAPEFEVPGRNKTGYIYNSYATHAGELMAAAIATRNCSASSDWFRVKTEKPELEKQRNVKLWLDQVQGIFEYTFRTTNFYTAYNEALKDKVFLGSACMFVGRHPRLKLYFQPLNIGECYPSINEFGIVNKMYRQFMMSVRNMAEKFGADNLSEARRQNLDQGGSAQEERYAVLHCVRPRNVRTQGRLDQKNMKWEDIYLEFDNNHLLREGGYREFPFIFSRYDNFAGHVMGRGPGWTALPDVMQLQSMEETRMKADQRAAGPSLLLPSSMNGPMIDLTPDGITFIDADENVQSRIGAFPASTQLNILAVDVEAKKKDIDACFFRELMTLSMDPKMTATQFMQTAQEVMQLLGPFVDREQMECLTPCFRRTFNLLWEQGEIPPPPPELMEAGGLLRIDYISAMALARKGAANQGILSTLGFTEHAAQLDPRVKNRFDLDLALQEIAENNGCPSRLLRSDEQVQEINKKEADQAAKQKQEEQMMEMAKLAPHLQKKSETGSPADQLEQRLKQGGGAA